MKIYRTYSELAAAAAAEGMTPEQFYFESAPEQFEGCDFAR